MTTEEKVAGRERRRKKQESLECPPTPVKTKRGRKPRSPQAPAPPSPPPPPSPVSLSFFKIMIGDFNKVLYIPPMAACTLKDLEKKYVYIEDADGKYWNVRVSMVDGSLAFQKGWDDFFSAHSIAVGEFVLFTYTGGLLFTARIFGTSSLERVDFRMKKKHGRYAKERCIAELKPNNVPPSKRKKVSHAFEVKPSPSNIDVTQMLERGKESAQFDFPSAQVVESDPIFQRVLEISSVRDETLDYESNCKERENVFEDSEQIWRRNMDATVDEVNKVEEPTIKDTAELIQLDAENLEAITKTSNFTFKAHSDIKLTLPERSGSRKMGTNGNLEENTSHNLEIINSEPDSENANVLSNPEHSECSKVEFNMIEPNVIPDKLFLTTDGICYKTVEEKLVEIATEISFNTNGQEERIYQNERATIGSEISVPCEDISVISSNHVLVFPSNEKESLISTNEEYEDLQIKDGICYNTSDENLTKAATGTSLDINGQEESVRQNEHSISVVSSNSILICASIKEENLMPSSEEYGGLQFKGSSTIAESGLQSSTKVHECIGHDAFIDEDAKDVTPCSSRKSSALTERGERGDSIDIPSPNCVSFSVCLSDDLQSSLELPQKLVSPVGKWKNERKVVLLQDLSMKCWPVLYHQSINFVGFIGGWVDFARANNICRGDLCEFELLSKTELKFLVQIRKQGSIF